MKVYGFNSPYSDDFDPYLVEADTEEEAIAKIREAYPSKMFTMYEMKEILNPGIIRSGIRGIYTLECIGHIR